MPPGRVRRTYAGMLKVPLEEPGVVTDGTQHENVLYTLAVVTSTDSTTPLPFISIQYAEEPPVQFTVIPAVRTTPFPLAKSRAWSLLGHVGVCVIVKGSVNAETPAPPVAVIVYAPPE
jgi:hypothetical protein